jgi:hypothetical protein
MSTSEKMLQTHACSALLKLILAGHPILFAGDMAGSRRTPAEALWAKNTGLTPGEPDLRVYGPGGRTLFLELKTPDGRLSTAQSARHKALAALGHDVRVLKTETGDEMARAVTIAVLGWLRRNTHAAAEIEATDQIEAGGVGAASS